MKPGEFTVYVDDTNIEYYGMRLVGYEIQSYSKRKTLGTDVPGAHGTQPVPSALSSAPFIVKVVCTGNDADELNTKIREFFAFMYSTSGSRKIVFSDDQSVIRYAVLDSPERYKVINGVDGAFTEIKMTFYMLDPFMHSSETSKVVVDAEHGKKFSVYNEAFECPAVFSLENTGTEDVTGVSLIVNGELASFSCILKPKDVLVLDTNEYEVRLNEVVELDYWRGEMPLLKNGENLIYQQNTEGAHLKLSVSFTKLWV